MKADPIAKPEGVETLINLSICSIEDIPPLIIKGMLKFFDSFSAIFKSNPSPVPSESIEVTIISPAPLLSISLAQLISSLFVSSLPKSFLQVYFLLN